MENQLVSNEKLYHVEIDKRERLVHQIAGGTFPIVKRYDLRISSTEVNPLALLNSYDYTKEEKYFFLQNGSLIEIPKKISKLLDDNNVDPKIKSFIKSYPHSRLRKEKDFIEFGVALNNVS